MMVATTHPKWLVVIPCLNEEEALGAVIAATLASFDAPVLVVDDGSTDATSKVAREAGALVVRLPYNLGVGAAIRTGMRYAWQHGYDHVVQVDGDGQHDPEEAKKLIAAVTAGDVDLAVGSRFGSSYTIGRIRRIAMRYLARVASRRLGTTITDATSGFRAFGPRAVALFARSYPSDYLSDTVEALLLAADDGLRVIEIPTDMRPRQGGSPSANAWKSALHLVRLMFVISLHRFRRPLAKRTNHR